MQRTAEEVCAKALDRRGNKMELELEGYPARVAQHEIDHLNGKLIIDRSVNGTGEMIQGMASLLKNLQNGLIRSYAAWILLGTAAIVLVLTLVLFVFARRRVYYAGGER